ncbi:MAG: hypothetical protein ACTSRG_07725 [Candidatus Helarchaeota archaeon]
MGSEIFYNIAQEIENILGTLLGFRVYSAIFDRTGKVLFARDDFKENDMLDYISKYIKSNFHMLEVGDHSFPISGKNLGFFKISDKCMIVLQTKKGHLGALLSFKSKMDSFASKIDNQIKDISPEAKLGINKVSSVAESKEPSQKFITQKTFAKLPILTKKLTGKEKFPIEHVLVLNLCDGEHVIEEIVKKTRLTRIAVEKIIRDYQKKKMVTIKRTQI